MRLGYFKRALLVVLILIFTCVFSASAVLLETTVSGEVTKINEADNVIKLHTNEVWNGESWVMYSVTSLDKQDLTGSVPDGDIFDYLQTGDIIQGTFTGDEVSTVIFVTVARVERPDSSSRYLSDSWGDPSLLVSPVFNNFKISYEMTADCNECTGSVCTADSSDVSVSQGWQGQNYLTETTMVPGEKYIFTSPEGCQSELAVTFVEGQASADVCSRALVEGPQPFSDFAIHVVQKGTETGVTVTPSSTITETVTTSATKQPEATQSPGFSVAVVVIGIMAALCLRK
ncbi:hypothetical protein [Methanolacinia petrolearia]|uniref:hypothetical protein n=1 Tax=Methanolacinia petrolearia TaxID=54120 RepID=UPI003BABBD1D